MMRKSLGLAIAAALTIVGGTAVAEQENGRPLPLHPAWYVVPRGADIAGQPYQHWVDEYGKWFFWKRTTDDPPPDANADCDGGQPGGPVFFIPHTQFGQETEFECTARSDQHVFLWLGGDIGIVNHEEGGTPESVTLDLDGRFAHSHGFLFSVDGKSTPAGGHTIYRPSFYDVDLPEDNIFGLPAGEREVTMVGSFVMLEPFPPGTYEIIVQNSLFHPADGEATATAISTVRVTDAAAE